MLRLAFSIYLESTLVGLTRSKPGRRDRHWDALPWEGPSIMPSDYVSNCQKVSVDLLCGRHEPVLVREGHWNSVFQIETLLPSRSLELCGSQVTPVKVAQSWLFGIGIKMLIGNLLSHIGLPGVESWLPSQFQLPADAYCRRQQVMAVSVQVPVWDLDWIFSPMALTSLNHSCCRPLGSKLTDLSSCIPSALSMSLKIC